ncbi:hypothetical protein HDV06_000577 [Boothiomyces sp. JEL0866]|nr:hypothetical protein HDV06_000577 [Boothiomyces sp. JEL0866]
MNKQKQSQTDQLFKMDSRLREYPTTLNFYTTPPASQINLEDFETWSLDRLQVLIAVDSARLRCKQEVDIYKMIEPVLTQKMELKANTVINALGAGLLYQQRKKDAYSHYFLRLAYCKTLDLQSWFIRQELLLFKLRFMNASTDEREWFVKEAKLDLSPISIESLIDTKYKKGGRGEIKDEFAKKFQLTLKAVYGDITNFYKVPFDKVPELVGKRQVIMIDGYAYIPESERVLLILNAFKDHLKQELENTAKALPRMDEDDRLTPILNSLAKQSISKEYRISNGDGVAADDVDKLAVHFPLCMKTLHSALKRDSHLKHMARIQFGLFLKGIGLSLDEALIYWRKSFNRMTDEEFQKKGYAYNIRYNYGMEGKRTNYTPYSCVKIIQSMPSSNESHGCPFRHFTPDALTEMMQNLNVDQVSVNEIQQKAKEGHYQIACTALFEATRGKAHEQAQEMLAEPIGHPNQYFDYSLNGVKKVKEE